MLEVASNLHLRLRLQSCCVLLSRSGPLLGPLGAVGVADNPKISQGWWSIIENPDYKESGTWGNPHSTNYYQP